MNDLHKTWSDTKESVVSLTAHSEEIDDLLKKL